jgi:hypothetical protein
LGGISKGPVLIELKPDLDDPSVAHLDKKRVMVEADLALRNHVTERLLTRKGLLKMQLHGPLLTFGHGPPPP